MPHNWTQASRTGWERVKGLASWRGDAVEQANPTRRVSPASGNRIAGARNLHHSEKLFPKLLHSSIYIITQHSHRKYFLLDLSLLTCEHVGMEHPPDRLAHVFRWIGRPEFIQRIEQKVKNHRIKEVIRVRRWQRKHGVRRIVSLDSPWLEDRTFHDVVPSTQKTPLEELMDLEDALMQDEHP